MEVPAIATAGPTPAKLKNGTLVNFTWAHVHAVSDSKEFTEPPTLPAPPMPKKGGIPVVPHAEVGAVCELTYRGSVADAPAGAVN